MIFQVRFQVLEKRVRVEMPDSEDIPIEDRGCGYFYEFQHVFDEVEAVNADELQKALEKQYSHENNLVIMHSNGSRELEVYHLIDVEFRANGNDTWRQLELDEFSYKTEAEKLEAEYEKREALKKLESAWTLF